MASVADVPDIKPPLFWSRSENITWQLGDMREPGKGYPLINRHRNIVAVVKDPFTADLFCELVNKKDSELNDPINLTMVSVLPKLDDFGRIRINVDEKVILSPNLAREMARQLIRAADDAERERALF